MALVVQNDDGTVSGANGYADLAFVRSYHLDRGTDLSATSDDDLNAAIVQATQYVDTRYNFVGCRLNRDQETEWPRRDAYDRDDYHVTGVPREVKQATADLAHRALTASLFADPERDATQRELASRKSSAGPLSTSVTFSSSSGIKLPDYPSADRILSARGLLRQGLTAVRA